MFLKRVLVAFLLWQSAVAWSSNAERVADSFSIVGGRSPHHSREEYNAHARRGGGSCRARPNKGQISYNSDEHTSNNSIWNDDHHVDQQWKEVLKIEPLDEYLHEHINANRTAAELVEDVKFIAADIYAQWAPIFPDQSTEINSTLQEAVADASDGVLSLPVEEILSEVTDGQWVAMVDACLVDVNCAVIFEDAEQSGNGLRMRQVQKPGVCLLGLFGVFFGPLISIFGIAAGVLVTAVGVGFAAPLTIPIAVKTTAVGISMTAGGAAIIVSKC